MPLDPCQNDPNYRRQMELISAMLANRIPGVKGGVSRRGSHQAIGVEKDAKDRERYEQALLTAGWALEESDPDINIWTWPGQKPWVNPCSGRPPFI